MELDALHIILLIAAGFAAGAINAAAGGGTLISFPAMLAAGIPALTANMTNTVALTPGYFGGMSGYLDELTGQRRTMWLLGCVSALGALAGCGLLLGSSDDLFEGIVPFLVLFACALLAAQKPINRRLTERRERTGRSSEGPLAAAQFGAAAYGAYFGAGLGVIMLALLGIFSAEPMQRLNALKTYLSSVISVISSLAFIAFGDIEWVAVAFVAPASLVGGRSGAWLARRMSPDSIRGAAITFGVAVAVVLLVR